MRFSIPLGLALVFFSPLVHAAEPQDSIEYLLGYVAKSDASFIRNGSSYSGDDAAKHLRRKYDYAKSKIASGEDFIRLCGTKSSLTGSLYMIKTKVGETVRCEAWLRDALKEHEKHAPPATKS